MAGKHIRSPAFLLNFFFYLLEPLDFAADQNSPGTVCCQRQCDGFSDSAAGTGNQGDSIFQRKINHFDLPSRSLKVWFTNFF